MTSVAQSLAGLGSWRPLLLAVAAVVIALLLAWVVVTLRRARTSPAAPAAEGEEGEAGGVSSLLHLRKSFTAGVRTLGEHVPGRDFRYRIPWVLMLGPATSGKSGVVDAVGLDRPFAVPTEPGGAEAGVRWAFFNEGALLDVPGDLLLRAGGGSDEAAWKVLLRLLQEHRTERPLDGVVLAVSAGELVGPGKLGREALIARAETVFARLWEAQKVLGMRFPVWVLVTQCDRVPGFRGMCARLPAPLRDEVFGWSSPYPVDAAFSPDWVDQAFDAVHAGLYETQVELLSHGGDGADADSIFRFPGEFRQAQGPLRAYLEEIFQKSVYHESFFFRGLYFTGDENADAPDPFVAAVEGDAPADAEADAAREPRHPVFLRDLFRTKVFAEGGLARPLPQALRARGRAVRWAQAAILAFGIVGGAGLWFSHGRLQSHSGELQRTLEEIESRLSAVHAKQEQAGRVPWESLGVPRMVLDMSGVRTRDLWSLMMPTSWFSGIRGDVEDAMTAAFSEVVLPAVRDALLQKADSLLPRDGGIPRDFVGDRAGPAELYRYVEALRDLNVNVRRYNALTARGAEDVEEMGKLLAYAFHSEPPALGGGRHAFYRRALSHATARPVDGPRRGDLALARSDTLVRRAYDDLIRRLDRLGERSRSMTQARFASNGGGLDGFRVLNDDISGIQGYFSDADSFWLDDEADLGPGLRAVLDSIPDTPLLDGRAFREQFDEHFREARAQKLLGLEEEVRTYGDGLVSLAPLHAGGDTSAAPRGALQLRDALRSLQQQSFYGRDPAVSLTATAPAGAYVTWDPVYLDRALTYHADYERYVQGGLKDLPVGAQAFVRGLATVQLEARMSRTVAQGVMAAPIGHAFGDRGAQRALRDRIAASRVATERTVRILGIFKSLGLEERYGELAGTLLSQDDTLLREADHLLERSGLYAPRGGDFGWWNGARPVAPAAFGVPDAEGVDEYLAEQRIRLRQLLDVLAAPVLADLEAPPLRDFVASGDAEAYVSAARVAKWRSIGTQLDAYEAKVPGNSLAALEQFVRDEMNAVEVGNCSAAGGRDRAGDFFAQARERLRASLLARCQGLARSAAASGYDRLRDQFQRTLAGRFPFAAPGEEVGEAGVEAVREFFRLWDELGPARRAVAAGAGGVGGAGSPAAEWLTEMEQVRAFLAPLLTDTATGSPYTVAAEFRANRTREAGADQVAAWSLDLGGFRLTPWDSTGSAVPWAPGSPARLALRWASQSEVRPASAGLPRAARVQDRTVTYGYGGEWALLRLLRQNAAPPADLGGAQRARHTLRFQVATLLGAPADSVSGPPARLFVRVRLLHPVTREEFAVPAFPSSAPFMRASRASTSD